MPLSLPYTPPYLWDKLLGFLTYRTITGVEHVADGIYQRTVAVTVAGTPRRGVITISHDAPGNRFLLSLDRSLLPAKELLAARAAHLLDLDINPRVISRALASLKKHTSGQYVCGTRLPGCFDPFEMAVRAILGQQITVKAACTLAGRFTAAFGEPLPTKYPDLTHTFPTAAAIAALPDPVENKLGPLGITGARARSIAALARALTSNELSLDHNADPETTMAKLLTLPGFGPWTANYVAMRALGWRDAFPHTDLGIKRAFPDLNDKEILAVAEQWRPWRSYATMAIWS